MRNFVKTTALLAVILLAGAGSAVAAQVEFGITIGRPPAVRVQRVQPRSPGPGYVWLAGYWYPGNNNRYTWHDGYWTRPPYEGARWVEPRHDGQQYYAGYWQGDRGRTGHDHNSDRGRDRDYSNGNGRGNNR